MYELPLVLLVLLQIGFFVAVGSVAITVLLVIVDFIITVLRG